jgi:hypothetical protein
MQCFRFVNKCPNMFLLLLIHIMFMCLGEVGFFMEFDHQLGGAECNVLYDRHKERILSEEPS